MNDSSKAAAPTSPDVARRKPVERLKLLETGPEGRFDRLIRRARRVFRALMPWIGCRDAFALQAALLQAQSDLGEGVVLMAGGRLLHANHAFSQITGYTLAELREMPDLSVLALQEGRAWLSERIARPAHACGGDDRCEFGLRCKSGQTVQMEVAATSATLHARPALVLLVRDVTDSRRTTARLRESEKLKEEFLSVVSHELRTPLTSIRGSLGLMASGKLGALEPRAEHLLTIAVNNAERLVRLINDLLDIERLEAGKCSLVVSEASLDDLMAHAVEVVRHMAERAQVQLEVAPAAGTLWGDADRLEQLLTNLLSNAIKFSPPGGVIRLYAERQETEWRLTVSDQGRGIPHDKLEFIFGRFQQVDASDSRQKGGTGLGLAICRSIAQQHGGRIWAESTPGEGSTFTVCLPAVLPGHLHAEDRVNAY